MTRRSEDWSPATREHFRAPADLPLTVDTPPPSSAVDVRLSRTPRRRHRVLRTNSARRALEPFLDAIDDGDPFDYEVMTSGEFSLLDAILVLLDKAGPSDVAIVTYTAGLYDMEVLNRFVSTRLIRSLRLVLNGNFLNQKGNVRDDGTALGTILMDVFGEDAIRTTKTHMKRVLVDGGAHRFTISGSANLNENKRLEDLYVSSDPVRADWFGEFFDEAFDSVQPGWNPDRGVPALGRLDPHESPVQLGTVGHLGEVTI